MTTNASFFQAFLIWQGQNSLTTQVILLWMHLSFPMPLLKYETKKGKQYSNSDLITVVYTMTALYIFLVAVYLPI